MGAKFSSGGNSLKFHCEVKWREIFTENNASEVKWSELIVPGTSSEVKWSEVKFTTLPRAVSEVKWSEM